MEKKIVIGILGKARAGKDTSAGFMNSYLALKGIPLEHESFARLLKQQVKDICYWDGEKDEAGRKLLQDFTKPIKAYTSTLAAKYPDNEFYQDMKNGAYYPAHTLKDIRNSDKKFFVITDFRFRSETALFGSKDDVKLITIRVNRRNPDGSLYKGDLSPEALADISENDLNDYETTYVIENTGTLEDLKTDCEILADEIFNQLKAEELI